MIPGIAARTVSKRQLLREKAPTFSKPPPVADKISESSSVNLLGNHSRRHAARKRAGRNRATHNTTRSDARLSSNVCTFEHYHLIAEFDLVFDQYRRWSRRNRNVIGIVKI